MSALKPYRIVQLSDLHLTPNDSDERSEPNIFKHSLSGMNDAFRRLVASEQVRSADRIVVTGDVTDRGDLASWLFFWGTLRRAGLMRKTLVVPGNHDMCCLGARVPRGKNGYDDEDLQKAKDGLGVHRQHPLKFPWVKQPDPRVAIIGLNSNNLGNFSGISNAVGALGLYQMSAFASQLYKLRQVPVKLVILHHSPNIPKAQVEQKRGLKPFNWLDRKGHQIPKAQEQALQLLCISHRVRRILHGHLHRAEQRTVAGIHIVGAPASTEPMKLSSKTPGYWFYSHTVRGKGGRVITELEMLPC